MRLEPLEPFRTDQPIHLVHDFSGSPGLISVSYCSTDLLAWISRRAAESIGRANKRAIGSFVRGQPTAAKQQI